MQRKVLLIEPNYKNKYPPMGLMKLATYFRKCGDDVRFFKGDLRDLAVELLFEEFWVDGYDLRLGEFTVAMRQYIKSGKQSFLEMMPDFLSIPNLRNARARYKSGDYPKFNIICVTTLFTFYWKETIDTINDAKGFLAVSGRFLIGGIASTLQAAKIETETGIKPYVNDRGGAQLDRPGQIDAGSDVIIDELPLDYSILDEIAYKYPASNAYFGYTTRGCVNRCVFCVVPKLEPMYCQYIDLKEQIEQTVSMFGEQKDLLLLDNNVFASPYFHKIVDEIKGLGFGKNELFHSSNDYKVAIKNIESNYNQKTYVRKIVNYYDIIASKLTESEQGLFYIEREKLGLLYSDTAKPESVLEFDSYFEPLFHEHIYAKQSIGRGRSRYVDFNQGVDARLMTCERIKKLSEINVRPLRIAFDYWDKDPHKPHIRPMYQIYEDAVLLAKKHGFRDLSNYLLYNTDDDTPDDLYRRLRLNVRLCDEHQISIYSFPMKYHPIDDPQFFCNRDFVGKSWNRKYIRAIQAVLNSTHGKIGRGRSFFEAAFGKTLEQFRKILLMPEAFIIERYKYDEEAYKKYLDGGGIKVLNEEDLSQYGKQAQEWRNEYNSLSPYHKRLAKKIIFKNVFTDDVIIASDLAIHKVLRFYQVKRCGRG